MTGLELAAEKVRKLRAEVIAAETSEKFHLDMAASAKRELEIHRRNLTSASEALVKEAQKTPGAAPVPGPRNNINAVSTQKVS